MCERGKGGRSHGQRENEEVVVVVGKPVRRLSVRDLCIDWNIAEEGGCGLLSAGREGSSECAAIFTSPPFPAVPVE